MTSPSSASPSRPSESGPARVFRLPASAYLVVLFLLFCVLPLAFAASGDEGADAVLGPGALLLLIPALAAAFIARTATVVDARGIRVRAVFGSRELPWDAVRGLSLGERSVYAVLRDDGAVRLPCVRVADISAVAAASAGRIPHLPDPPVKAPPTRRRRGR